MVSKIVLHKLIEELKEVEIIFIRTLLDPKISYSEIIVLDGLRRKMEELHKNILDQADAEN